MVLTAVKNVNVYFPSLAMKVPDHVYVLNDMHSSSTFQSVSFSVCQHETVITCTSTDSLCSVFPYPYRNLCPHMRIRNESDISPDMTSRLLGAVRGISRSHKMNST